MLMDKSDVYKNVGKSSEKAAHHNIFMPVSTVTKYKGVFATAYLNTFLEDARMVYGYQSVNEVFVNDLN